MDLVGKQVIVFYEDGTSRVSRKDGVCSGNSSEEIILESRDNKYIIPKRRIVRIEVGGKSE